MPALDPAVDRPKYIERIEPLHFPESAEVPETQLHLELRTLLYQLLSEYLGERVTVGSDQFVYLDASNPQRCIAPDVFAKTTPRGEPIRSWKVWERGAPDLAVEIISESDATESRWEEKLAIYHALGVKELVRVDIESGGAPLRVWNRTQEVLAERAVGEEGGVASGVASLVFPLFWVIAPAGAFQRTLRIATELEPLVLVPTAAEGRAAERQAKEAAETRVRELEQLLRSKG